VRGLEAMTTDLRERLADMTARRDSWRQQVEAVNRQIADQRDAGRAADNAVSGGARKTGASTGHSRATRDHLALRNHVRGGREGAGTAPCANKNLRPAPPPSLTHIVSRSEMSCRIHIEPSSTGSAAVRGPFRRACSRLD